MLQLEIPRERKFLAVVRYNKSRKVLEWGEMEKNSPGGAAMGMINIVTLQDLPQNLHVRSFPGHNHVCQISE